MRHYSRSKFHMYKLEKLPIFPNRRHQNRPLIQSNIISNVDKSSVSPRVTHFLHRLHHGHIWRFWCVLHELCNLLTRFRPFHIGMCAIISCQVRNKRNHFPAFLASPVVYNTVTHWIRKRLLRDLYVFRPKPAPRIGRSSSTVR